ncbi:MAG: lysophospholipid acyltransferase family protein [Mycobacteriales bacterium]
MGLVDEVKMVSHARDWRGRSRTPRSAERWAAPKERREFPTAWARTTPARLARAGIQRGLLGPLVWSQVSPRVYGADRLDRVDGPVVIVANHSSHLDTPLLLRSLPPRLAQHVAVGAAADYFFDARWRATVSALMFNAFPVERLGNRRIKSIAPELLAEGWNLLLFPEATRSPDGWMHPFRLGTAQLCCNAGVPAVPVAIRGAYAAMPRGRNWPRPGRPRIAIRFGPPLVPETGETAADFSVRMLDAVTQLWAEEELGWWGSSRAAGTLMPPTGPAGAEWRRQWEATRPLPDAGARGRIWRP